MSGHPNAPSSVVAGPPTLASTATATALVYLPLRSTATVATVDSVFTDLASPTATTSLVTIAISPAWR
jgi:hypothetical protein